MSAQLPADFDFATTGVILVDHGSRRDESNDLLLEVVAAFDAASPWRIVEPAHMELAEPSIATAFARCIERSAKLIVVFPYFLAPGRHWHSDIPRLAAAAAGQHNDIPHVVTAPLGLHPLLSEVIGQRIAHCLSRVAGDVESCDVCTASTGCRLGG